MIALKSFRISASIGIFALLITIFTVADAAAQCTCYSRHTHHVARTRVRRSYYTARVRTVYRTVYVPQSRVASYVAYDDTDNYSAPASRVVVTDRYATSSSYETAYIDRIAYGWGHRDGWKDGWKAALKSRRYDVENNHDYHDANNGYKREFGSKFLYKASYRDGYVKGYDAGYRSIAGESYGTRY